MPFIARVPSGRDLFVFAEAKRKAGLFGESPTLASNGYFRRLCGKSYMIVTDANKATLYASEEEAKADLHIRFELIKVEKRITQKSGFFD
jgi:hypothetical protein